MATKKKNSYGFGRIVNLILAIFPFTNIILGIVKRIQNKSYIGAILNFFLSPLFYIVDLITVIVADEIKLLA